MLNIFLQAANVGALPPCIYIYIIYIRLIYVVILSMANGSTSAYIKLHFASRGNNMRHLTAVSEKRVNLKLSEQQSHITSC
jgi:hypothetical protein